MTIVTIYYSHSVIVDFQSGDTGGRDLIAIHQVRLVKLAARIARPIGSKLHTITLTGFKGGTGRTVSAAALAQGLVSLGHHVALIDAGHAVPLQESVLSETRGRGSPPHESTLCKWVSRLDCSRESGPQLQYIRASTAAYLDSVMEQLLLEAWHFAVIDTPAHPTASVFEATARSSLLVLPARDAADANAIVDTLPHEFLDGYHTLRCLVAGSQQPKAVRNAFAPLQVLDAELHYEPKLCTTVFSTASHEAPQALRNEWRIGGLRLAREISELVECRDDWPINTSAGLIAT